MAEYLGISKRHVGHLRDTGCIDAIRICGRWKYDKHSVDRQRREPEET
jgi:hypothetical protein